MPTAPFHKPVFFIIGPTASGKSALAAAVAQMCGAEIVGADAFQVYRGLDLLTAKPSAALLAQIRHHLVGVIPLTESFDVGRYIHLARQHIESLHAQNKPVLVVGGTGLYVRALTHGMADLPSANLALRAQLETLPLADLHARLKALDPQSAESIDAQNPRRLIRALEVCLITGKPYSGFRKQWDTVPANVHGVILKVDRAILHRRINQRTLEMFDQGVVAEVGGAGPLSATACQAIGLREIKAQLAGQITQQACITAIQLATRRYAKRQETWFRRETVFQTIDANTLETHNQLQATARRIAQALTDAAPRSEDSYLP